MQLPVIVVNFKLYESASGSKALALAQLHAEVAAEKGVSLALVVSALDIRSISEMVSLPVFIQHIDPCDYGAFTGFISAKAAKEAGAFGTLLNHAEHKLTDEVLQVSLQKAREAGLYTIVCAESLERAERILKFGPDLIALEPPELIGGDISVSTAQPDLIQKAVEVVGGDRLLVGAGVKTKEDIQKSLEFGASGVLLASGITKAQNPKEVLMQLSEALL